MNTPSKKVSIFDSGSVDKNKTKNKNKSLFSKKVIHNQEFTLITKKNDRIQFPTMYRERENNKKHYQGVIYLQNSNKEFLQFRVFKDKDLGIPLEFQHIILESVSFREIQNNDEDKVTQESQMALAKEVTLEDLIKGIKFNRTDVTHSQQVECLGQDDYLTSSDNTQGASLTNTSQTITSQTNTSQTQKTT